MRTLLSLILILMVSDVMHGQTIKVMSYNIRLDTEADGVNQWKNRTDKVITLIRQQNPDLFGVQEALHNQMQDLQNGLGAYRYVGVGRDDGKTKGEYSAIFYKHEKFELITQNTFWLSETPEVPGSKSWDAAITRIVTLALLKDKATHKTFLYANTHFDHMGKEARKQSAVLIKRLVASTCQVASTQFDNQKIPVIISGDFNSEPTEAPYLSMTNGEHLSLFDARPANNLSGTFCGFAWNAMPCKTIDYIFHSVDWKASDYAVIETHDGHDYPSDHLPVVATLRLK